MDPAFVTLGVQAALAILRQVDLYSRGAAVSAEELDKSHDAVLAFMNLVAFEVEKRHSKREDLL